MQKMSTPPVRPRTAFPAWARKTLAERAEVIQRFADLLTEHKTRLA